MKRKLIEKIKSKLSISDYKKLSSLSNIKVIRFIIEADALCNPKEIFICSDTPKEKAYIRRMAILTGEENPLKIKGHTYHFDGYYDQGRDREVTKFLVPEGDYLNPNLNQIERKTGLEEIKSFLKDAMQNRTMIVRFLTLGPANSRFAILCME
ncbi:MAG: phosphoenolpyruvate carboxykinase, partial [Candidatus Omnitrophica bacterium]|nr:phosphoenolpyruvate carboxykinase [Candidatus Omnitrophota bacterium]